MATDTATRQAAEGAKIVAMAQGLAVGNGDVQGDIAPVVTPEEKPVEAAPAEAAAPVEEALPEGLAEKPVEEPTVPQSVFQKRIDEKTAETYELRGKISALEAQLAAQKPVEAKSTNPNDAYTDGQLEQIAVKYQNDPEHPEYAVRALRELNRRDSFKELQAREDKRALEDRGRSLQQQHQQVWNTLVASNPDLAKPTSELYQLANAEYQKIPEQKRMQWPEEMDTAVQRAKAQLAAKSNGVKAAEVTRKAVAEKKGLVPLGGNGRAASPATSAQSLEKLHQAAQESGNTEGPEWMAYLRAQRDARRKGKKED